MRRLSLLNAQEFAKELEKCLVEAEEIAIYGWDPEIDDNIVMKFLKTHPVQARVIVQKGAYNSELKELPNVLLREKEKIAIPFYKITIRPNRWGGEEWAIELVDPSVYIPEISTIKRTLIPSSIYLAPRYWDRFNDCFEFKE